MFKCLLIQICNICNFILIYLAFVYKDSAVTYTTNRTLCWYSLWYYLLRSSNKIHHLRSTTTI